MDPTTLLALLILCFMFVLLAVGMPIGFAMGLSAFVGTLLLIDGQAALALLGQTAYDTAVTYNLSVVPMFVLMGYIAGEAGLSESLYRACNAWLGHRRGGLALATIGGCGAFAAICGSSLATAATMAQIALPEMRRYNYDDRLATGAVAAGGTIGILIPPSVIMVIYGLLTETSISTPVSRRVRAGSSDRRRVHAGDCGDDPHRSAPWAAGCARVGARNGSARCAASGARRCCFCW